MQIAQPVSGIFIKTAGNYKAIPGDNIGLPQFPAMIGKLVFGNLFSVFIFFIPAEFFINGNQLIGIIFIIINLGSFKTNFINTHFCGKFFYFFYLVFIWLYYQELEKYKWCFAFKLFLPLYNVLCSFNYFIDIAANPVLLIHILGGSVNGNDKPVQPALTFFVQPRPLDNVHW